jgi:hypothetical protein
LAAISGLFQMLNFKTRVENTREIRVLGHEAPSTVVMPRYSTSKTVERPGGTTEPPPCLCRTICIHPCRRPASCGAAVLNTLRQFSWLPTLSRFKDALFARSRCAP